MDRREFLKTSVIAVGAIVVGEFPTFASSVDSTVYLSPTFLGFGNDGVLARYGYMASFDKEALERMATLGKMNKPLHTINSPGHKNRPFYMSLTEVEGNELVQHGAVKIANWKEWITKKLAENA